MIVHRRAAALIATTIVLLLPAVALGSGAPPASLNPTAPSWLKPVAAPHTSASTQTSAHTPPSAAPARGTLPRTGFDLLPEVLLGAGLVVAGVAIQVALRIRRA